MISHVKGEQQDSPDGKRDTLELMEKGDTLKLSDEKTTFYYQLTKPQEKKLLMTIISY